MCSCHLAPLSAIIHTMRATHSQHHTLFNSHKIVRSPILCIHFLTHRRQMALLLQVSCPAHRYHAVQFAHKFLCVALVMSQVKKMPLADAITQLSFLEFLQHCGVSIAPPQPSQVPVPISLLDAAVQATPPCDSFRMCRRRRVDQPVSSLSLDVAVQMSSHGIHISSIDAAVQTTPQSTPSQHVSTQIGSRSVSSFSVDIFVQTPIRSVVLHDVAIQLPITKFFTGCIFSNDPLDRQNLVRQPPSSVQGPRALLQPPPGLEQLARLLVPLLTLTCVLHMAHLQSAISVTPHSLLFVPPKWEHILCAQLLPAREVLVPPLREPTVLLARILVQEQVFLLNHGPWSFPWSVLGNPSPTDLAPLHS